VTAVVVTAATFAKSFVPFYLISTPIFVATCVWGLALIALASRTLAEQTTSATDILIALILLYGMVMVWWLLHRVPITHLLGILVLGILVFFGHSGFSLTFLLFGFAASRALKAVFRRIDDLGCNLSPDYRRIRGPFGGFDARRLPPRRVRRQKSRDDGHVPPKYWLGNCARRPCSDGTGSKRLRRVTFVTLPFMHVARPKVYGHL
jgi:hypothetical protein